MEVTTQGFMCIYHRSMSLNLNHFQKHLKTTTVNQSALHRIKTSNLRENHHLQVSFGAFLSTQGTGLYVSPAYEGIVKSYLILLTQKHQ